MAGSSVLAAAVLLDRPGTGIARSPTRTLRLEDFLGGGGPQTQQVKRAFAAAAAANARLTAGAVTVVLDDDIRLSRPAHFQGSGAATRFVQTAPGRGFLRLGADGNHVSGLHFECSYERRKIDRRAFRGYLAFQRVAAIWLEGGRSRIDSISAENAFNVVCLRGPVRFRHGSTAGRSTRSRYDFIPRARGNRVTNISGTETDFVVTGNQQEDLVVAGVTARSTTNLSVPPHAVYLQNPGAAGPSCGRSIDVVLRKVDARDNPHAAAVKVSDVRGLRIDDVLAQATAGGIAISTCDGASVSGVTLSDQSAAAGFDAIDISRSNRVTVRDVTIDLARGALGTGVRVRNDSLGTDVRRVTVTDRYPASATVPAPFRVEGGSQARFTSCSRTRAGADREMFIVLPGATARIRLPSESGSSLLLRGGPRSVSELAIDPGRIPGYDRSTSVRSSGVVRYRIRTSRARIRGLPGAKGGRRCSR